MPSHGALTLFFRWRKKSVQKKASGTATPGKSPLLPILTAGLAMSRASWLASSRLHSCALGARLFPPPKWAGLFPSAAYRRSAPPRLALDRLKWRCLRGFGAARMISQCGKTGLIFLLGWRRAYSSSAAVDILDISVTQNASVVSNPRWHLLRAGGPGARRRSFLFN